MAALLRTIQAGSAVLACALFAAAHAPQHRAGTLQGAQPAKTAKPAPPSAPEPDPNLAAIRANNVGVALMDRHDYPEAIGKFQTACIMAPQRDTGCLNSGIALLNTGHADDARRLLEKFSTDHPENPRVWFNLALLERSQGNLRAAMDDLQKVAKLDPDDPDTQFFIGFLEAEQGHDRQAAAAFQKCLQLDPLHVSAEYGLSQALQHLHQDYDAQAHLERFHRLTALGLAKPVRFLYGEQGQYSRAEEMLSQVTAVPLATPVHFADVTAVPGLASAFVAPRAPAKRPPPARNIRGKAGRGVAVPNVPEPPPAEPAVAPQSLASFLGGGACILDYDGDGRPDVFLVDGDGKGHAALFRNAGGGHFVNVTKQAKIVFQGEGTGCAVADYDNDGHPDLVISSSNGIVLLHNNGHGAFDDMTDAAGVRMDGLAMGATFIDYDQDGDIDLYVTRFADLPLGDPTQPFAFPDGAPAPGNVLWRNKGDGTFEDATKAAGLAGSAPSIGAIGTHVHSASIDLVLAGWQKSPFAFLNTREGAFRPLVIGSANSDMPGPTAGVVSLDFDRDGWMDLAFTHWASPALSLWRNVRGKSFERVDLPDAEWMRGWGVAAVDYDRDGWPDLVAVGETYAGQGRIRLLRNEGPAGFRDVTQETGLDKITLRNPRAVIPFDPDGNGSLALLITQNHLPPVLLRATRTNKNGWIDLTLAGDGDNKLGIGAKVDLFYGAERQSWEVPGASGYLGQGMPQIDAGLGAQSMADVVRIQWPTGMVQESLQVPGGKTRPIEEESVHEAAAGR